VLRACIDTNVWLSGVLFSGPPAKVVELALQKRFDLALCPQILEELERNLHEKFDVPRPAVRRLTFRIAQIADIHEPAGNVHVVREKAADNLILEAAALGRAKYLVTGDQRHLLPLKTFRHVRIVTPAAFLKVIGATRALP